MYSLKHRHPSIPDWITCLSLHPKVALVNQDISHALEKIIFKDTIQARNSRSDHHSTKCHWSRVLQVSFLLAIPCGTVCHLRSLSGGKKEELGSSM